jgi:hypothetical protein
MKSGIIGRIFMLLFITVCIFTAFWIFHTHTVLENNDAPHSVVRLFNINNDLLYNIVAIFSLILLVISNIFYWRTGKGIYFLLSVFYFSAGVIALAILQDARFWYTKQNGLWKDGFASDFFISTYLIIAVIIITLIDFFIIKYLRKKSIMKYKNL